MEAYAASNKSPFLTKRLHSEPQENTICPREPFQRDRDRIIHSRSFRRMMHKTQVFNANKGDHYRNRLTHTLEVSQIARSIGKALHLNDELIEAIALGHDLGHTPFGHSGERILNEILMNNEISEIDFIHENFRHNFQSLRVVDFLETRCNDYLGINLTLAVREGILKHTKTYDKKNKPYTYNTIDLNDIALMQPSFTLEGQVVAISDEIAQCTHDLEDGVRSKIIDFYQLKEQKLVQMVIKKYQIDITTIMQDLPYNTRVLIIKNLVGSLIEDVFRESQKKINEYCSRTIPKFIDRSSGFNETCICFSPAIAEQVDILSKWIDNQVIYSESISISDAKAEYILKRIFKAFYIHPKQLPDYILEKYFKSKGLVYKRSNINDEILKKDPMFVRAIADHIAGMTDQFASREYQKLYLPDYV
jgi:dGTPase